MKKIFYHGGTLENLQQIVENGVAEEGHASNLWSGLDEGLFVSDSENYAAQYGEYLIAIEIDEKLITHFQECPLHPSCRGCDTCTRNDDGEVETAPNEYVIEYGVKFEAWFI